MSNPSWRQLCRIPESLEKAAILNAVAIEAPAAGISPNLRLESGVLLFAGEGGLIVYEDGACYYSSGRDVLKQFKLSKGTPSGDLVRWWLQAKGLWSPPAAKPEAKPEAPIL